MPETKHTTVTVCETCKRPGWDPEKDPMTDGEKLAASVEKLAAGVESLRFRRHPCLMGCDFACNVSIQSEGKVAYAVGTFDPDADAAEAIVEFAALHAESDTGVVPYRSWPQGIKGHFRSRILPVEPQE